MFFQVCLGLLEYCFLAALNIASDRLLGSGFGGSGHSYLCSMFIIPENKSYIIKDLGTNPVKVELLRKQAEEMGLDEYGKIVVLGGKEYIDVVAEVFLYRN